ncbi:unnamed protein product [Urochloa humidicola]
MAAMRSALAMLGRRSCGFGSSAASSMGGRGLEVHRVPRPAAVEGWRQYTTVGRKPTEKAEGVLRTWWQRWYTNGLKSEDVDESTRARIMFQMVVTGTALSYYFASLAAIARL